MPDTDKEYVVWYACDCPSNNDGYCHAVVNMMELLHGLPHLLKRGVKVVTIEDAVHAHERVLDGPLEADVRQVDALGKLLGGERFEGPKRGPS